jgi:hypothetical protein
VRKGPTSWKVPDPAPQNVVTARRHPAPGPPAPGDQPLIVLSSVVLPEPTSDQG